LHARHGHTYYLATLLLPAWKGRHVHALYGFTRYADELVDDLAAGLSPAEQAAALRAWGDRFFAGLRGIPSNDPILPAVLHTVRAFALDVADFERFLERWPWTCAAPVTPPTMTCSATWRARRRSSAR
jgi:15-cis-phytoene synthase